MSFLVPLALLLGFTAVFPLIAHALRRGQARPISFPAARFVPSKTTAAKERHRIEDKWLLLLRTLLLLCLAALAASPFVQCSRLSLSRTDGASLAGVLVIDDSASMRANDEGGRPRLEKAVKAASELILTAQPGDSFAIVLAGQPARVLTPPTTELSSVAEALSGIEASDRETDLSAALTLARSLVSEAEQEDRPLVLLSDLAISSDDTLNLEGVIIPDAGLTEKFENCALISAVRSSDAVQVETACTSPLALQNRFIELLDEKGRVTGKPIQAQDGALRMPLDESNRDKTLALRVRLTPPARAEADAIASDDSCPVLETASSLTIALRADQAKAGLKTGAGTVLQAGLEALERNLRVETLSLLPDQSADLNRFAGLMIDDPSGFTPEVREALQAWVQEGGVAVLLLGEGINRTPLGSDFSPFLKGAPTWSRTDAHGANEKEPGSLGPLSTTWADIGAKFRANLGDIEGAEKKASWNDGQPLVIERLLGRGLLLTVTLPSSVDTSDLALRPAFLRTSRLRSFAGRYPTRSPSHLGRTTVDCERESSCDRRGFPRRHSITLFGRRASRQSFGTATDCRQIHGSRCKRTIISLCNAAPPGTHPSAPAGGSDHGRCKARS